jgi:hypothetical protein
MKRVECGNGEVFSWHDRRECYDLCMVLGEEEDRPVVERHVICMYDNQSVA